MGSLMKNHRRCLGLFSGGLSRCCTVKVKALTVYSIRSLVGGFGLLVEG